MKKIKAIITGANGQDGSYLTKLLLEKGYMVFCLFRPTTRDYLDNHHFLNINENHKNASLEFSVKSNILSANFSDI